MKTFIITICLMALSLTAQAETTILASVIYKNKEIVDLNKRYGEYDKYMCWAYISANMLAYTINADPEFVLKELRREFPNEPKSTYMAIKWFVQKHHKTATDAAINYLMDWYARTNNKYKLKDWIMGSLAKEQLVSVGIAREDYDVAHGLTVYGYRKKNGQHQLLIVDSDDEYTGLVQIPITLYKNKWYLNHENYEGYYIDHAFSLKMRHVQGN